MVIVEIPTKLPSLNDYINECRRNRYAAGKMKQDVENEIGYYLRNLKPFHYPIKIHFHWIEGNKRRDFDNISSGGRKFILDALVKFEKLPDDNRRYVRGFTDTFEYGDEFKVILEIEEVRE